MSTNKNSSSRYTPTSDKNYKRQAAWALTNVNIGLGNNRPVCESIMALWMVQNIRVTHEKNYFCAVTYICYRVYASRARQRVTQTIGFYSPCTNSQPRMDKTFPPVRGHGTEINLPVYFKHSPCSSVLPQQSGLLGEQRTFEELHTQHHTTGSLS